jgi:AraC-like DNA-binding protein
VLTRSLVAEGHGYAIAEVGCDSGRPGFDGPEEGRSHILVAVRRGAFVRRAEAEEVLVDGTVAYLSAPGIIEQFAHPVGGGDVCTAIYLSPSLMADLAGGDPAISSPALPIDACSELALRQLTAFARRGDAGGFLTEHLVRTLASLVARRHPGRVASGRPATARARGRMVNRARAAMRADPSVGLIELAAYLACSPHHLSRVFKQLTGVSISHYRNRQRVSRALDRIAQGDTDLARLAYELGFSDHAHLTRTIRAYTGHTPTSCRSMLTTGPPE